MGPRLGIFNYGFETYPSDINDPQLDSAVYPKKQLMSFADWQHIIDYYTSVSPDSLQRHERKEPITMDHPLFTALSPQFTYDEPGTSFVKVNADDSLHPVVISDVMRKQIYFFNKKLELKDSLRCGGPIVDMIFSKDEIFTCNIGVLSPNNGKTGKGQRVKVAVNGTMSIDSILFDGLRRPVNITPADLNKDGKLDYIICEFGNLIGSLSWMENKGDDKFEKHDIRKIAGAIKAYTWDYDNDGDLDIYALFAQGEEAIFLFTNNGNGSFDTKEVLRFPPSYGSSSFELTDFNKDGLPDIVYTCGDNADYSVILKPYHGVYIYLNDGKNNFTQKYFYPINGCYKALARDFDNDGDLDLATISFFADYQFHPEEGFIFLKNEGGFNFTPFSVPATRSGRWLTMDAGDLDNDGKLDIVLGNFSIKPANTPHTVNWKKEPPFLILKNVGGKSISK